MKRFLMFFMIIISFLILNPNMVHATTEAHEIHITETFLDDYNEDSEVAQLNSAKIEYINNKYVIIIQYKAKMNGYYSVFSHQNENTPDFSEEVLAEGRLPKDKDQITVNISDDYVSGLNDNDKIYLHFHENGMTTYIGKLYNFNAKSLKSLKMRNIEYYSKDLDFIIDSVSSENTMTVKDIEVKNIYVNNIQNYYFTVNYQTDREYRVYIFNPPDGDIFKYTKSIKSFSNSFEFSIPKSDLIELSNKDFNSDDCLMMKFIRYVDSPNDDKVFYTPVEDLILYIPVDDIVEIMPKGHIEQPENTKVKELDFDSSDIPATLKDIIIKKVTAEYINDYYKFTYDYESTLEMAINIFNDDFYYARKLMPDENSICFYVPDDKMKNSDWFSSRIYNPHNSFEGFNINIRTDQFKDIIHSDDNVNHDINLELYNFNLQKNISGFNVSKVKAKIVDNNYQFTIGYVAMNNIEYSVLINDDPVINDTLNATDSEFEFDIPIKSMIINNDNVDKLHIQFGGRTWQDSDNLYLYSLESILQNSITIPIESETGKVQISIENSFLQFSEETGAPFIDDHNRTQVPLRITMEAYGCTVEWDSKNKEVIVKKDNRIVCIPIGQKYIVIDNQRKEIDTAAMILDNRTYLPIRAVVEAYGATVEWRQSEKTVVIN